MAVQAQHPSSVFFFNRGQEKNEVYSSQPQPQPIGLFDQQFLIPMATPGNGIFNSPAGDSNTRKRWRDDRGRPVSTAYSFGLEGGVAFPATINLNAGNQNQSSQPSGQMEASLLNGQNYSTNISTGLRLSSEYNTTQMLHRQPRENLNVSQSSSSLLMEDFASNVKRQRDELDQLLLAQTEELSRVLAEKRQRHLRELLGTAEMSLNHRLRDKDAEMEKAVRRNAELEARATQLSVEAQIWQARARAQEAAAASLQAQLQEAVHFNVGKEDGCGVEGQVEDAESAHVDPERATTSSAAVAGKATGRSALPGCKACGRRVAQVVILPCRHLCLCSDCGMTVQTCPVCLQFRQTVVEVVLC